jgi:hypothetical protein
LNYGDRATPLNASATIVPHYRACIVQRIDRKRMSYTLATAAKATGLNKSTILRAIKTGQITGTKDEFGEWRVEPAELHRVYPAVAELSTGSDAMRRYAASNAAALDAEIEALIRRAGDRLRQQLEEMRCSRDAGCDQAQTSHRKLADQAEWRPWRRRLVG